MLDWKQNSLLPVNKLFHAIKVWLTCLSKINIINKYHSNTVIAMIEQMSQSLFYAMLAGSAKADAVYLDAYA